MDKKITTHKILKFDVENKVGNTYTKEQIMPLIDELLERKELYGVIYGNIFPSEYLHTMSHVIKDIYIKNNFLMADIAFLSTASGYYLNDNIKNYVFRFTGKFSTDNTKLIEIVTIDAIHKDFDNFDGLMNDYFSFMKPLNKRIILNRIKCPDGTILTSYHTHDYKDHTGSDGNYSMIDGGNEYLRRGGVYEEMSVYSDAPYEVIRESYHRGGRGKDGKQPLTWVPMSKMSDEWLKASIEYNIQYGAKNSYATGMYKAELQYREINKISIVDVDDVVCVCGETNNYTDIITDIIDNIVAEKERVCNKCNNTINNWAYGYWQN